MKRNCVRDLRLWLKPPTELTTQELLDRHRFDCTKHSFRFEKRLFAGTTWQLRFRCEKCAIPVHICLDEFRKLMFIEESENEPLYKPEAAVSHNIVTYEALTPEGMIWAVGNSLQEVSANASIWPGDPDELNYRSKTVRIIESRPVYAPIKRPEKDTK